MRLYINIDHVATVREARRTDEPDPVRAAVLAELGGADGITVHLRADRRHIQDRDVELLMQTVRSGINLEIATDPAVVDLALRWQPMQITLVPETREEVTTEGGLALHALQTGKPLAEALSRFRAARLRTSLFLDPDPEVIRAAADLNVEAIELHTGEYARARGEEVEHQRSRLARAAALARSLGLAVHAGHGLTLLNVAPIAAIEEIEELNIGHSIVSHALFVGMESAVREMKRVIQLARGAQPCG